MSTANLETLMNRLQSDPSFKQQLQQDPAAAASQAGVTLTEPELQALQGTDWSLPDQELQQRVSKRFVSFEY